LKKWITATHWGVATKYLQNYLNWSMTIETVLKNEKNQTEALGKMSMMERILNFETQ